MITPTTYTPLNKCVASLSEPNVAVPEAIEIPPESIETLAEPIHTSAEFYRILQLVK